MMNKKVDKEMKMEYYVLYHEFNGDEIKMWNIFNSTTFYNGVQELLKKFITFDDFKDKLESLAIWSFWSKAEYEIICSGLSEKYDKEYKIDIYDQLEPNLDMLARYIIYCYNNRPRARKRIEIEGEYE